MSYVPSASSRCCGARCDDMSPAPPATNSSWRPAHANRLRRGGDTASRRNNEVRRSSGHDRVNCRIGTRTVDALQLLQRLLSRLLVSYRPLANIEERRQPISPQPYVGRKIMIQQVASSARQTLAAAKATSLQRCVRTQLRAGSHCLNPRARSRDDDYRSSLDDRATPDQRESSARAGGRSHRG